MKSSLSSQIELALQKLELNSDFPELYNPIAYTIENGGKRIRPLFLMLSAKMFGVDPNLAIHQALAIEIFHNFTLLHDDVMDNAPLRRGKPSVFKKWNISTAILSGDVMFSLSLRELSKCNAEVLPVILNTFVDITIKVCEGQQMDMDFENSKVVNIDDYMKMIELKTAYLIGGCLKIGAQLGKANEKECLEMFSFGLKAGTAFQIIDDYLDAFGDPDTFGKQTGGDILSGKKTYLFLETEKALSGSDREEFLSIFNSKTLDRESKVSKVKFLYEKSGSKDKLKRLCSEMLNEAEKIIENVQGDLRAKEELINLTRQLSKRQN